jgi:dTDP-4-dehydrorhamnose 3,5-epimerase
MNLTGENGLQMYIPQGCAHGFLVLSREALFSYKCTEFYAPDCEQSLAWNDPGLHISWPIAGQMPVVSEKDNGSPPLASFPLDKLPVYERGSAI